MATVRKFHVFFREVQFQFQQSRKTNQFLTQLADGTRKISAQLIDREAVGPGVIGGDEVAHGFGLCEVKLAVEKGARREFTRTGVPATGIDEPADELGLDKCGAVDGDFHGVLSGKGAGRPKHRGEAFVEDLLAANDFTKRRLVAFEAFQVPREQAVGNLDGLRTGDANDRDATHSGRRRNRADGFSINCSNNSSVHGAKFD